ncbi:hypothetical protein J8L73_09555 [Pseudoalteromonas sp. MMG006]|uniref:hypothetical protein n=1 Tax=Pseudoalteromonas sp. MMG006 TaxID=2822683 RepID=UPI001B37C850|nr:hypothetical protein [Pseudoalteromonas sp. MMG006]MBQ4799367.1 hypothetical protein [Pseudoalteromonas sp. MMG006]
MFKKCVMSAALILALCACNSETESHLVETKELWAGFNLVSDGSKTRINAELNVNDITGSNVTLSDSDTLQAAFNSSVVTLKKDTEFLDDDYQAYINTTDDNQLFNIIFGRSNGISASSNVELPLNFIILTPSNEQLFKIDSTLTLQLDGTDPNSTSYVELTSRCITLSNDSLIQSGTLELSSSHLEIPLENLDMFKNIQIDKSKSCNLTLSVIRERFGNIADEFTDQSYIKAQQSRAIKNMTLTF